MKTITKSFFILVFISSLFSCSVQQEKPEIRRKYKVQLSNWVGSEYYKCDTVLWVNEQHLKLKNKEQQEPFMDIIVNPEVTVRVCLFK
jgi:hypothetical protein